jgi:sugar phosphate isomerase/epimerase
MSVDAEALARPPDAGKATGMTVIYAGLDLEQAAQELEAAHFEAAEVFVGHLGPRVVPAPVLEAHAAAARELLMRHGLALSTLNCIVGEFDPFTSATSLERTAASLAKHLMLGAAIGAPRVLIWDGELDDSNLLKRAPEQLARVIERGRELSGLGEAPGIAVELHPNTFAFKHRLHEEVAQALLSVGAGVCLDFCHAAVAFGPNFVDKLSEGFLHTVSHVHFADSDCESEQLHFPPGEGRADIEAAVRALSGRGIGVAWDLFGWPEPRYATKAGMGRYRAAVKAISADGQIATAGGR